LFRKKYESAQVLGLLLGLSLYSYHVQEILVCAPVYKTDVYAPSFFPGDSDFRPSNPAFAMGAQTVSSANPLRRQALSWNASFAYYTYLC